MARGTPLIAACAALAALCTLCLAASDYEHRYKDERYSSDRYKEDRYKEDRNRELSGAAEVRHEMDNLVDGVKDAMRTAQRVHDHKEVVDLGQSLHLLEHKFAGLKQAIAHELGTKLPTTMNHNDESKRLIESSSRLLDDVAAYRAEMQRLMGSVREIDDSIRAIRDGMASFDQEVDEMNRLLAEVHVKTNDLHENHQATGHQMGEAGRLVQGVLKPASGSYKWYYLILIMEIAAVAYFFHTKGVSLPRANGKQFGKFG